MKVWGKKENKKDKCHHPQTVRKCILGRTILNRQAANNNTSPYCQGGYKKFQK
jgi:hypothetical protein